MKILNIYIEKNFIINTLIIIVIFITLLILIYSLDYMNNDNKLINFINLMFFF